MALTRIKNTALDPSTDITADQLDVGQLGGRRNLIINGAMQVAQRGTPISFDSAYTLDRWRIVGGGASGRVASQENNTTYASVPHEKYIKVTNPQSLSMWTTQRIENARQFSGKTITISYWVWSTTGSYDAFAGSWGVFQAANSNQYNVSGWGGSSVSVTTIPQYVTHTINFADISSYVHTEGDFFEWSIYHNTANDICLTGVQLELGSVATPFEHRSYGEELALCQRYYQIVGVCCYHTSAGTNHTLNANTPMKTSMRASPTMGVVSYTNSTNVSTQYPPSTVQLDKEGCMIRVIAAASGDVDYRAIWYMDAEL